MLNIMKKQISLLIVVLGITFNTNAQWQQIGPNGVGSIDCIAIKGNNIFAGSGNTGVYLSSNNGDSWAAVNTGLSLYSVAAFAISGDTLFAGIPNGGVYMSSNNGTNWIHTGLISGNIHTLAKKGNNFFAGALNTGIDHGVYFSTNNGQTWLRVNSGLTNTDVVSLGIIGNNIFAGTNGGGVFLSSNNGNSWVEKNTGLSDTYIYAITSIDSNIFVGTGNGIFLSTNNGSNWAPASNGIPPNSTIYAFAVIGDTIIAGTQTDSSTVFMSLDYGNNWISISDGFPNNYCVLSFATIGDTIYAGTTTDHGVWRHNISGLSDINSTYNDKRITLYPNPATDFLKIENTQGAVIEIINITGQIIQNLRTNEKNTYINISTFSKGLYFLKITNDNGTEMKKFIKM